MLVSSVLVFHLYLICNYLSFLLFRFFFFPEFIKIVYFRTDIGMEKGCYVTSCLHPRIG